MIRGDPVRVASLLLIFIFIEWLQGTRSIMNRSNLTVVRIQGARVTQQTPLKMEI